MVLFDHNNILRRYKTPEEICEEFFMVRLKMYIKRKEFMVGTLESQSLKLDNIARFIKEKIDNVISVENKKISAVIDMLVERKYQRDPEKVWREEARRKVRILDNMRIDDMMFVLFFQFAVELSTHAIHEDSDQLADLQQKQEDEENEEFDDGEKKKVKASASANRVDTTYYDYLINMSLRNLTKERRDEILKDQKEKHDKLEALKKKSPEDLYEDDIANFEAEYHKVCSQYSSIDPRKKFLLNVVQTIESERADEMSEVAHHTTKKAGGDNKARKRQTISKPQRAETKPAPHGKRITPVIDPALIKKVNEEIVKRSKVCCRQNFSFIKFSFSGRKNC